MILVKDQDGRLIATLTADGSKVWPSDTPTGDVVAAWISDGVPAMTGSIDGDTVYDAPTLVVPGDDGFGMAFCEASHNMCWTLEDAVLGRIAAGAPREAIQDADEILPVSPQFFRGNDLFALRVKGDSMKDVGILPGDIAVLNRQQDVGDGEIAAVLLDEDATLKFVHRRSKTVVLRGANPDFPDIIIRNDESRSLRILGKYVGLIRQQGGVA